MAGERHPADVVTRDLLGLYQSAGVRLEAIVRDGLAKGLDPSRVGTDAQRAGDSTLGYRRRQLEQAKAILAELDRKGAGASTAIVTRAYSAGVVTIDRTLTRGSLGGKAGVTGTFGRVHVRAVEALAGNLDASLRAASAAARQNIADVFAAADALEGALPANGQVRGVPFLGRRFDDAFRAAALAQVAEGAIALDTRRQVSAALANRLIREGTTTALTGFVDRAGRRWTLESYTAMVARTTTREAMSSSTAARMAEHGIDLVTISQHSHAADLCTPYEGRTFSLSGGDPTYPELDRRPPFHPNCRHVMAPAGANLDEYEAELEAAAGGKPEEELKPVEPDETKPPATRKPGELTDAERIANAETMFGTGSKQHRDALAKWGAKPKPPALADEVARLRAEGLEEQVAKLQRQGLETALVNNAPSKEMGKRALKYHRTKDAKLLEGDDGWLRRYYRLNVEAQAEYADAYAKLAKVGEETFGKIGDLVSRRVDEIGDLAGERRRLKTLAERARRSQSRAGALRRKYVADGASDDTLKAEWLTATTRADERARELVELRAAYQAKRSKALLKVLGDARPGFGTGRIEYEGDARFRELFDDVARYLPKEWVDDGNVGWQGTKLRATIIEGRAEYRPYGSKGRLYAELVVEAGDKPVTLHEYVHHLQSRRAGFKDSAVEFYRRRVTVKGKTLDKKRRLDDDGDVGYRASEVYRGAWSRSYIGKDYGTAAAPGVQGGPNPLEIQTMGIEGLFHGKHRIHTVGEYEPSGDLKWRRSGVERELERARRRVKALNLDASTDREIAKLKDELEFLDRRAELEINGDPDLERYILGLLAAG